MKANRSTFSKVKQQYDIRFIGAALSEHERNLQVVRDMFIDEDGVGHEFGIPGLVKDMHAGEIAKKINEKETLQQTDIRGLKYQIKALEELRGELLDEEKYEEVQEAEEILVKLKRELNKLKNGI